MIAGMPVKTMQTSEQIPRTRLAIALPLVTVAPGSSGAKSGPTGWNSTGLGTTSSRPQSGHFASRPAFSSRVWNC